MPTLHLESLAFAKILLHASKYPHLAINGVLLGEYDQGKFIIQDCVPLFHGCLTLAAMLEVALSQIESYCETMNLKVCGYYQANELANCNDINQIATRIGDKIAENTGFRNVIMLNNDRLTSLSSECFTLYCKKDNSWQKGPKVTIEHSAADLLRPMLSEACLKKFADFDNHLDDVSSDWRNSNLFRSPDLDKVK
nr:Neighbor of COX4 [Hymenolepis microstoma]